ncbi:MAG: hypothetical protein ABL925_20325, partial [Methylococcales bacterium]
PITGDAAIRCSVCAQNYKEYMSREKLNSISNYLTLLRHPIIAGNARQEYELSTSTSSLHCAQQSSICRQHFVKIYRVNCLDLENLA